MEAGIAAMEFITEKKVTTHSNTMGREMLNSLKRIQKESKFIGDVRGIGMMFGIEYVKNKSSKEPFSKMAQLVRKRCYENGLLVEIGGYYDHVILFLPPLILTSTIVRNGLDIFRKANKLAEKKMRQQRI
jgi:diaminobutyrate-2-oxoglutarate transaminase